MKNRMMKMLRIALAMMLIMTMLMTQAAFAAVGTLMLPSKMKNIGAEAFKGNVSVVNVTIPDGTESIGEEAFAGCTALQRVTIPDSVVSIGENAFDGCGDVLLVCSYDSAAGEYARANGIEVDYTDDGEETGLKVEWDQLLNTVYPDGEDDLIMGSASKT